MTSAPLSPVPHGTHLVHVATWASDVEVVDAALAACADARTRVSSLQAGARLPVDPAHGDVHVLLALRAPETTLARGWLRDVEAGGCLSYEEWLPGAMDGAVTSPTTELVDPRPLVEDLVRVHGASSITVSATVDSAALTAPIEQLAGLAGSFADARPGTTRPLTVGEAEMIRGVNLAFAAQRWPEDVRLHYTAAISNALRAHDSTGDSAAPAVPSWAQARLHELHDATLALVSRTGVGVCGDLRALAPTPAGAATDPGVRPAAAARAVAAAIVASGVTERPNPGVADLSRVDEASVRQVLAEVAARLRPRRRGRGG